MRLLVVVCSLTIGCSSVIAVRRPLSAEALAEINAAIASSRTVSLTTTDGEVPLQGLPSPAPPACGSGNVKFGQACNLTEDCECGLACQAGRCLGSSLKAGATATGVDTDAQLYVGPITTEWLEARGGGVRPRSVPTAALQWIHLRNRGKGAIEGIGVGFLAGAIAGGLVGGIAGSQINDCDRCGFPFALIGAVALGVTAALLVGLPIGAIVGHRTTVEFDP